MSSLNTFPKLLLQNAERFGERAALREKEFGIWRETSWRRYGERVRDFSLGLVSLGLEPGGKVAIIGDNRPEWVIAELAAQSAGGASVGIYQDSNLTEVGYVIDHCDARFVIAEDQEQVDKILGMIDQLPKVAKVIYADPRGLFSRNVAQGQGSDLALICYTSGTTGSPKGAMLTFANLLSMALSLHQVDPRRQSDEFVSFLPLAWIGEQMMSLATALAIGFTINFPEEPETALHDIREIGPNVMFAPPRIWEGLHSTVQVKIMDTTPLKRFIYERLMPVGYKVADLRLEKGGVPALWRVVYFFADWLLFRPLKDRLGLSNLRSGTTGGAALGPDVFRFFHAMGVRLKQIYGQTEISGISCIHRDERIRFHTVGEPIPGTEVRITERGEILSRSPAVFLGYYKNEEATRATLTDSWLHSGDAGYLEDGQLVVIDRIKDVLRLRDGTQFSPQFIENRLKFSPYVKEAVVIGQDMPYLSALVCIDQGIVGKWAEKEKISYTTYTDLSAKPRVYDLLQKEIDKVNKTLPAAAKIRKFVLLYKELDADDEELTRTRKVRRSFVEERYKSIIAALYGDERKIAVDTTIRYQDGRTARIQANLAVRELGAA
ncbi:MAG: long-chain fatty acid--CoA ligase [Deltaproteobacteria bacterium]|nr:MAG: long-chain fatty acid--CoA ligase [Deltaproteobacteria bacterium]